MSKSNINFKELYEKSIPISELSRGKLSKVLKNIHDNGRSMIVYKDNKPYTIIMSIEEYESYMEIKENFELLKLSIDRVEKSTPNNYTNEEEVLKKFGISGDEIEILSETVEID